MVRSGWLNLNGNSLAYFGINGYSWSNTTNIYSPTTANAYDLNFYTTEVRPTFANARRLGFPVRCLVYKLKKRKTLYFVRSGSIYLYNSSLVQYGFGGTSWSSSAVAYGTGIWDANAYSLKLYDSGINPSNGPNARWNGLPVRCLVILVCCVSVPTFEVMTARRAEPGQNHDPSFSEGFDFERLTRTEKVGTETH